MKPRTPPPRAVYYVAARNGALYHMSFTRQAAKSACEYLNKTSIKDLELPYEVISYRKENYKTVKERGLQRGEAREYL